MKRTVAITIALVLLALGSPASAAGTWTNAKVQQQLTPIVKSTNIAIATELSEIRSKKPAKVFAGLAAGQSLVDALAVALYSSEVSTAPPSQSTIYSHSSK